MQPQSAGKNLVEQHKRELESFKSQSDTLLSSGTDDVTRSANALHDKADELMQFDVIDHVDSSLPPMNVTFMSFALLDRKHENLVGTVTEGGQLNQICSVRKDKNFMVTLHCHAVHSAVLNLYMQYTSKISHTVLLVYISADYGCPPACMPTAIIFYC